MVQLKLKKKQEKIEGAKQKEDGGDGSTETEEEAGKNRGS